MFEKTIEDKINPLSLTEMMAFIYILWKLQVIWMKIQLCSRTASYKNYVSRKMALSVQVIQMDFVYFYEFHNNILTHYSTYFILLENANKSRFFFPSKCWSPFSLIDREWVSLVYCFVSNPAL